MPSSRLKTEEMAMLLGILLVVIGLAYLLSALGVIAEVSGDVVWPLILVGVGVWLISNRLRYGHRRAAWWCGPRRARGE